MAMPNVTILYSFLGIVEVVVGEWVMEDFPRRVELVPRGHTSGRAVAGGLFFAAFLCGLKSTLRRGVELIARGNTSRRAIAGGLFFAAFLCGLKSTLRRGVELVSRIEGGQPLGESPGVSEVPAHVVPCGSPGPPINPGLPPHGKTAEGAVLQMGPPTRHRRPPKTLLSTFSSLLSRPQAAGERGARPTVPSTSGFAR